MEYVAEELGVTPIYLPALQREISPLQDLAAARQLLTLIRRLRPDILHTHTAKAGAVGRLAAQLAGPARPTVVVHTFHGHVLRGYFGPAKTEAFRRLEQGLARSSDALIAVSPEVRDDLVALGVAPAEKITVIRLGLDLEQRLATAPGARRGSPSRARCTGRPLSRQLARPHDGDQARRRPAPRLRATPCRRWRRRSAARGRRPAAERPRGICRRARNQRPLSLHRVPHRRRRGVRGERRDRAHLGQRGHAGDGDRGAGGRQAGRVDRRRRRA